MAETVTIPKAKFEAMKEEIATLRNAKLYKRLLEFEKNIQKKRYTRKDLGF
jgi:PHD/YefM family antitoxin component YafN of YafNO toxin-antitoxin module